LSKLLEGDPRYVHAELLKCQKDPWYWLMMWVRTENSHSKSLNPFERFPDKPHLFYLCRLWQHNKRLLVPKTRQVTATWLFCALYLWESMFFPSKLSFLQSKKESESDELLERCFAMYMKLPQFMKAWQPLRGGKKTYCNLSFARNRSRMIGIPEGAEHLRGYTPTGLFVDEAAFHDDVEKMMAAALPAIGEKGRVTMVSSAMPGYFKMLCFNEA